MDKEYKFGRMFLILKRDDEGFGLGKDPAGYVKIEVADGKGKLFAHFENLNDRQEKAVFKLYLIKCVKEQFNPVCVGILPISEGKGELTWRFDASNVDSTGISIDKFNIIAVVATEMQRKNSMAFPLVSNKGADVSWKDKLKETLYPKVLPDYQNSVNINSIVSDNKIKDIQNTGYKVDTKNIDAENMQEETQVENQQVENIHVEEAKVENQQAEELYVQETQLENQHSEDKEVKDTLNDDLKEENIYIEVDENKPEETDTEFIQQKNSANKNSEFCNKVNGCASCLNDGFNKFNFETMNGSVDTNKLKELFNKNFEVANPFKNGCRIYKWWEVTNPVVLNNIFYQCNLRNPFLFNPKVLFAYYKHRNLIVGLCNDISNDKEYIVLGVPGNYSVDQRPLGVFCRWAQEEGVEPKNGAFGFWLVYIDVNSGKIVG
ncbi:hypothetical protein [Pseudobacteroides cellulosolvens]|uniref:Uncharacterized protein n=1 Tax=Pseudobacteroides cellulosolvens ATCC 35603 = DSM 2933 TaxID=398512 RepID=A0A0L6JSS6_9FIRM|nr:hypothetical protein [Pseudobacteroides cellulosolvens]KNY28739.1 hypothetical protein Bccel_4013 [Pseudobacteroides cellulosolvens ATCC 35603 = DSM 2933]